MNLWHDLTSAGDSAVLLPLIAWITLWLIVPAHTRRDGWRWIVVVGLCGGGVAVSKLIFMAWGIGLPGLDYTGFSGHSAMSMLVWPSTAFLLTPRAAVTWRTLAIALGFFIALGVAASRIALKAHSVSEVVFGTSFGLLLCGYFLMVRPAAPQISARAVALLAFGSVLIALLCYGRVFPSQHILKQVAMAISGHEKAFARQSL